MKKQLVCLLCVVCTGGAVSAQAPAHIGPGPAQFIAGPGTCPGGGTVYVTTPPDQVNGFFSDAHCGACVLGQQGVWAEQAIAMQFTLPAGGTVGEVVFFGGYFPGNTPFPGQTFRALIHNDSAGVPGTNVSDEPAIVPLSITDTGVDLFGVDEREVELGLAPVVLAAGTYWLEIFNETSGSDDWIWETGSPTDPNQGANGAFSTTTPGSVWDPYDYTSAVTICDAPIPDVVEIFEIQGSGLASPFEGFVVTTEDNIVTAVGPNGFFVQTPDDRDDADPATSNGIYVYTGAPPPTQVGDQVDLTGQIQEFFELTEFGPGTNVSVDSTGNPLPQVVTFDSTTPPPDPATPADALERYEGMRITMPVGRTTGATDEFGETWMVAKETRTFREPGIAFPGLPGLPVWDGNPEVMKIDPEALGLPPFSAFAGHDLTADGNLAFTFGEYILWPSSYTVDDTIETPIPVRPAEAHEFTVATQNLLRFFDDQDDPNIGEPVLTPQEFADRLAKTSLWVRTVLNAPDILAVQEVENLNVVASLATRIALDDPTLVYSAYLIEGNDVGGIDVGYLTRDDRVQVSSVDQFGEDLLLSYDGTPLYDRPPLVLEATIDSPPSDPIDITVINVHQRSLGGIEGDQATRVKIKRLEQAEELAGLIQQLQTDSPALNLLVTGDFNAFEFTDGYVDVMGQITGDLDPLGDEIGTTDIVDPNLLNWTKTVPSAERYSVVFKGNAEALDHVLTSSALSPRVSGVELARGNADTPASFESDPATALRTSDHDGLVTFLVAPGEIFADGFESGDTSAWSNTVP